MILNLGPRPNSSKCFSICHCNLNNITSHSFIKVSLLSAYNAVHNFDMVLGKLPPTQFPPKPNSNANPKPNPDPHRGAIFLGGNFLDTL